MFNPLKNCENLQKADFSPTQAKAVVSVISDALDDNVVTKFDLMLVRQGLEFELKNLESRLTIKLGTMLTVAVAAIASMVKFLS